LIVASSRIKVEKCRGKKSVIRNGRVKAIENGEIPGKRASYPQSKDGSRLEKGRLSWEGNPLHSVEVTKGQWEKMQTL